MSNGWRFLLYELNGDGTESLLNGELPLSGPTLTRALSKPHVISGTLAVPTRFLTRPDGKPLIRRWKTMVVAEDPNEQIWLAGLVAGHSIDGPALSLDVSGFTGYAVDQTYMDAKDFLEADPLMIYRHIWDYLQGQPGGNLGLVLDGATETPERLGHGTYATDENGVRLTNLAIPHPEWDELYDLGWVGGPVNKVHVSDTLWAWLINHGFNRTAEGSTIIVPPATWTEEFPWWEAEILNLGWVGGPVRKADVRIELWDFLTANGWVSVPGDTVVQVFPPSKEPDDSAYPDPVWIELHRLEWAGGTVRKVDVAQWVWDRLLQLGWTPTADPAVIQAPEDYTATQTGLPGWETDLLNKGWVGGPVRHADVTQLQWDYLVQHRWTGKAGDDIEQVYPPDRIRVVIDENDLIVEAEPYSLNWWSTPSLGAKLDELTAHFDYLEEHSWADDTKTRISHRLRFGYPTIGNRLPHLRFVLGENVFRIPQETAPGDEVVTGVLVLGAGEGRDRVRGSAFTEPEASLRRVKTITDKTIESSQDADARAAQELARSVAGPSITELVIRNHPNSPLGSYNVGDEILYMGDHEWGDVEVWVKIVEMTISPENSDDVVASVVRTDRLSM